MSEKVEFTLNINGRDHVVLDLLSSNLCRCTGYQNIVKAVRSAAADMRRAATP